ncbi:hypothetical protein [Telluria aromaticivorans]|uniref:Uncharacterized protein n=1 Tax=Telluria aromaticivorans TaxID=2725995 RepID=A0A7Y2JYS9_9BURK|nr:hypothetical protein [Telluria aromaticivorans]NNG23243.1 hypothetical protein [Telluria aromaticivorans]
MLNLFKRPFRQPPADLSGLGAAFIALPVPKGGTVPDGCFAVLANKEGRTRRLSEGARLAILDGESAWCIHPGPYGCDLVPFAAAPEIGLRVSFAIDSADPREAQQRFDLFLASEGGERVALDGFVAALQAALQRELAQGNLDLPPCTSFEEWNAFRTGFNQLLYTRYGVMVDDCVPVDLGASRDLAALLTARLAMQPAPAVASLPQETFDAAAEDRTALRRLFLELPCVLCGLRLAVFPPDCATFRRHQELLRRLDLVSLSVGTMPALALAAPNEPLAATEQLRRARHSRRAAAALDEAWALLARIKNCGGAMVALLLDEADRIVANLECDCAARRATSEVAA